MYKNKFSNFEKLLSEKDREENNYQGESNEGTRQREHSLAL